MFLKLIRCTGMLLVLLSKCYISFKIKKYTVCKNFHFITYKMIKKKNDRYNTNYDKL